MLCYVSMLSFGGATNEPISCEKLSLTWAEFTFSVSKSVPVKQRLNLYFELQTTLDAFIMLR